jgi:Zn-dependent alcohol dehydrogenase
MKAAVCREFGKPLAIEELELAPPGPGEIRVKIAACAVCHSDIHYAEGAWGGDLPAVYGHEAAGVVEETGPGVATLNSGDHVVVTLIRSCGHCHYCARGEPFVCETQTALDETSPLSGADGSPMVHGLRTGAFAEYAVVHESQAVAIPKEIPLDSASLLACGVITGLGAVVNTAGVRPGSDVAVIGVGGVGLNSIQGAVIAGARRVIAVDIVPSKLEAAMQFGATHAIDGKDKNAAREVRALTERRGAGYVFVTVGAKPAIEQALRMIGPAGGASGQHRPAHYRQQDGLVEHPAGHPLAGDALPARPTETGRTDHRSLPAIGNQRGHSLGEKWRGPAQRDYLRLRKRP